MVERPSHLPTMTHFARLREASARDPANILMSGCLARLPVGVDGSTYGEHPLMDALRSCERVRVTAFCPENAILGTPRPWCDIADGDGHDVLDGKAKVLAESGEDVPGAFMEGARQMTERALASGAVLAVLMDISAACGSQVIYRGSRIAPDPLRQAGQGVALAALMRAGIAVVSQRDFRTLRAIFQALDLAWTGPEEPRDHHQSDWYRAAFGTSA